MSIGVVVYVIAAYWAAGKTIYANKIVIGSASSIFLQRVTIGFVLGVILIPLAIIKSLLER